MSKKNINFPEIKSVSKKEKKIFIESMKNDNGNSLFTNWNSTIEKVEDKFNKLVKKNLFEYVDLKDNEVKYFFILDDQLGKDGTYHVYYFKSTDDISNIKKSIAKFLKFLFDEKNIQNIVLHVNSLDNDTFSILKYNKVMQFEDCLYYVSGINEQGEDEWSKLDISLKDSIININESNESNVEQNNNTNNEDQEIKNEDNSKISEESNEENKEAVEETQNTNENVVDLEKENSTTEEINENNTENDFANESTINNEQDINSNDVSLEENNNNEFAENTDINTNESNEEIIFANDNVEVETTSEDSTSNNTEIESSQNGDFVNVDLSENNTTVESYNNDEYQENLEQNNFEESHEQQEEEIQKYNQELEKENLEKAQKWADEFYQLPGEDTNGILSTKERFSQKKLNEYDPLDITNISYDLESLSTLKIKSDNVGNSNYNTSNFSTYEQARKNVLENLENLKRTNKQGHDSIEKIGVSKNNKEKTLSEKSNASVEEMVKRINDLKEKINN